MWSQENGLDRRNATLKGSPVTAYWHEVILDQISINNSHSRRENRRFNFPMRLVTCAEYQPNLFGVEPLHLSLSGDGSCDEGSERDRNTQTRQRPADAVFRRRTFIVALVFGSGISPIHLASGLEGKYSISYSCNINAIMSLISCTAKKRPGHESLP